jgi:3-dehydroquinate dehydratase
LKTQFTIESTSAKKNAGQNPTIINPGTKYAVSIAIRAFMTSEKRPSVRMVIGRVRMRRIGRMNRLIAPRITAATSAPTGVTMTPGTMYAATKIAIAEVNQWKNIFILKVYAVVFIQAKVVTP